MAESMKFNDVAPGDYFFDAVQWAFYCKPQVTDGVSKTRFAPEDPVTRGQAVTFLWRTMGKPGNTDSAIWYEDAKRWAGSNSLLDGTASAYRTDGECPRADVILYMWRALTK